MSDDSASPRFDDITIFETEDGKTRVEVRFEHENVWLTQKLMAELYECSTDNISLHLRHIFPLPYGLEKIFARFKRILVPELNMGQLARYLTSEYPQFRFESLQKVQGKPFKAAEIRHNITSLLEERS